MAMTKAEKAKVEELKTELALRWTTDDVSPDVPPPPAFGGYSQGWTFNAYNLEAYEAWSSSLHHGRGKAPKTEKERRNISATQRPIELYSTRERALRAMRRTIEREAAKKLRSVDALIEGELAS